MFLTTTSRAIDVEFAQHNGLFVMEKPSSMVGYAELAKAVLKIVGEKHADGK